MRRCHDYDIGTFALHLPAALPSARASPACHAADQRCTHQAAVVRDEHAPTPALVCQPTCRAPWPGRRSADRLRRDAGSADRAPPGEPPSVRTGRSRRQPRRAIQSRLWHRQTPIRSPGGRSCSPRRRHIVRLVLPARPPRSLDEIASSSVARRGDTRDARSLHENNRRPPHRRVA